MIKSTIQTFLLLFILISGLIIYYWRDIQYDPSSSDLLLYFGILPGVVCLLLFTPYFIYKAVKQYQQRKQKQQKQADLSAQTAQQELDNLKEPSKPVENDTLHIFSAAAWHCFGENAEILEQMRQFKSPELDSTLFNNVGLPVLAYRIHALDHLLEENRIEEEIIPTLRQQRIQQLIQQQLEQHQESLSFISSHLKRSALFYDHDLAYQYRMHPGWTQENYDKDDQMTVPTPAAVTRLNRLNLHVLLGDSLIHAWDNLYREQLLNQIAQQYALVPAQIHIEFHFLPADAAYSSWLDLVQDIAGKAHEINLIIVADSEIDQEYLDDQFWQNEHYIAAEYTASWCLSGHDLIVEGMTPSQMLNLGKHVTHLHEYLRQHQVDLSAQLEQTQPFLMLLDEVEHSKTRKKIQKSFENIDFESEHVIYAQRYLGHTQHLAAVFAAMLSVHLLDNVITIAYSTQQESSYLYVKNIEIDQQNENSLVA